MVFAEVSGNKIVAMVNARNVCGQVREASDEALVMDIDFQHSVVIAADTSNADDC